MVAPILKARTWIQKETQEDLEEWTMGRVTVCFVKGVVLSHAGGDWVDGGVWACGISLLSPSIWELSVDQLVFFACWCVWYLSDAWGPPASLRWGTPWTPVGSSEQRLSCSNLSKCSKLGDREDSPAEQEWRILILSLIFQACYCALDIQGCFFPTSHSLNISLFKVRDERCHPRDPTCGNHRNERKQTQSHVAHCKFWHLSIHLEMLRSTLGSSREFRASLPVCLLLSVWKLTSRLGRSLLLSLPLGPHKAMPLPFCYWVCHSRMLRQMRRCQCLPWLLQLPACKMTAPMLLLQLPGNVLGRAGEEVPF